MNSCVRSLAFAFCIAAQLAAQTPKEAVELFDGKPAVAGELLVKFRDGSVGSHKLQSDRVKMRRLQVKEAKDLGESGYTQLRLSARQTRQVMAELAQDPDVEYVEPNYLVTIDAAPNDPGFAQQWGLQNTGQSGGTAKSDIDATSAWDITKGAKTHVIGVVDTGVDYTHPDLKDNMWKSPRSFTVTFGPNDSITCPAGSHGYNALANSCDPKDSAKHGTMVAGVIAASGNNNTGVTGVNWSGSIMALGFIGSNGSGSVGAAIRAIEFAIQAKRALGADANIRVLNNSWGGSGYSQALLDQILKANAAGILFVAAAGNSPVNIDTTPTYPASYNAPNLLTVAATDHKDALASFSSFGAKSVHLGAPGVSVVTTSPGGGFASASGTSFASPMTAGVAGLVLAACPQLDTAGLRKAILDQADPVLSLNGKTATGGRLNAFRAVRNCATTAPSFKLTAPTAPVTLSPGSSVDVPVQISAAGGFSGAVALTTTGLPAGVTGVFAPASAAPGTAITLKLTAASTAALTTASAASAVRGVSGTLSITAPLAVNVLPPFTITATPAALTVNPGGSVNVALKLESATGFKSPVTLSASGLPAGVTGVFTPATAAPGTAVTLKLTAAANAAVTAANVAASLRGVSGIVTATAPLAIGVRAPFTVTANPGQAVLAPGGTASIAVKVESTSGFTSAVTLGATGLPAGVTAVFTPATAAPGATVTLRLTASATASITAADSAVTIAATSGALSASAPLRVGVKAPFTIAATPGEATLAPNGSVSVAVRITSTSGFAGAVALSASGLPSGVTAVFTPASATPGTAVTLRLTAAANAALTQTNAAASIRGVNGSFSTTAPLSIGVRTTLSPSFDLAATPATLTVNRGQTATFTFAVTSVGGFNQPVSLNVAGLPANAKAGAVAAGTGKLAFSVATSATTPASTYNVTVTAAGGTLRKTAVVTLIVK